MVIANVTQGMRDPELDHLWQELVEDVVGRGNSGKPYESWSLLDRLAFCWMLARGPVGVDLAFAGPKAGIMDRRVDNLELCSPADMQYSCGTHPLPVLLLRRAAGPKSSRLGRTLW